MLYLMVFIFCVVAALGIGILAGMSDFKGLTIPNMYPVMVAGAALPAIGVSYFSGAHIMGPPLAHLVVGFAILVITFVLFSLKVFGGGDSKLLAAYALWAGPKGIVALLFYMAISGAVLGIFTILVMKRKPFKTVREGSWIARVQAGENRVPYGIPIVIGAVIAFLQIGFFSPGVIGAFVQ